MRRVVWFAVGAGVGVYALVKVRHYVAKASPQALVGHASGRVKGTALSLGESAREFVEVVRARMAERETELRDAVGLAQPGHEPADPPRD
ncbi:MAG: DUF6167 family protein [Propionibacteriaceae bacterium]